VEILTVEDMFLNRWTAQLNCPGQIVERAFDSEEELLAFIRRTQNDSSGDARPRITVIDPKGKEQVVTATGADGQSAA